MPRTTVKYRFDNGRGQMLAGLLDMPGDDPRFFGVFGPCFTCPKESHAAAKTCRHLADNGVAMLRIDVTGQGESEGYFAETNFTSRVLDLISACASLRRDYAPPRLLVGHSISGTAALSAGRALPYLQAVATIGSPHDPASIIKKFKRQNLITDKGNGIVEINVLGQRVTFKKTFLDDMQSQNVGLDTEKLDKKLFVFHAPHDSIVSFAEARLIYDRATCDKELVPLDEAATHLFENRKDDAVFVAETLLDWFRTHLG